MASLTPLNWKEFGRSRLLLIIFNSFLISPSNKFFKIPKGVRFAWHVFTFLCISLATPPFKPNSETVLRCFQKVDPPPPKKKELELFLLKSLVFRLPAQWCLACISGHSLELICRWEIAKQIHERENHCGGWAAGTDPLGRGFIRLTTPSSSQQQIHYNNGLRSHQRADCGSGKVRCVDTEQSALGGSLQCVKPGRKAAHLIENRGEWPNQPCLCASFRGDSGPGSPRPHLAAGGVGLNGGPETLKERRGS